ncbi:EAL domain-containing protein [Terriglobus saanensis]|uniref:Diguanylate phosphodiesterase n=1 Tax=Terriglobus saanensis (strain ATCC BAA-1853 / DSM 23119 / SP1PR4) TaxID=401053 RepID=E8V8S0_TERSS|nr:EAL domain-containing protein [Terriglobus saanensis]ADV84107.1 diguanylate phosphodiesterase [Terriglobus saanensis SP1PR4]
MMAALTRSGQRKITGMFFTPTDAQRALALGEFVPYYQPVVVLRSGEVDRFEVLARWNHPTMGMIMPNEFISVAERDGWIGDLMHSVLGQAFTAAAAQPVPVRLAVNISPVQLHDLRLPRQIASIAESTRFSLSQLTIEVIESALTDNIEHALTIANELHEMGCKLSLDDFGTGYSSLLHLQSLPFDELKVDRSFVGSMTVRRESRKIVAAVVGLGQSLGLTTVAEGVETCEQDEMLLWLGCDHGQGWLYGKPVISDNLALALAGEHVRQPLLQALNPWRQVFRGREEGLPAQRLAQLQAVFDGSPVALAFLDKNSRCVNLNQKFADIDGIPVEEHFGKTVKELFPELYPIVRDPIERALRGESIPNVEVVRPAPGGEGEITLMVSYQPAHDEAGEVIGVSIAAQDITDLKKSIQARQESEDHFRYMVELNPQVPFIVDPEGRALQVSHGWAGLTGMQGEEWRGYGWLDALHPEDVERTRETLLQGYATGAPMDTQYRVRAPGGLWRWMRARSQARLDENGKILCWYGGVEDIHDQKDAEDALRKCEAQLQAIFDAVPFGLVICDAPGGKVTKANSEAHRIFPEVYTQQTEMSDLVSCKVMDAKGNELSVEQLPSAMALKGQKIGPVEVVCHGIGPKKRVKMSAVPIHSQDGEVEGVVTVLQRIEDPVVVPKQPRRNEVLDSAAQIASPS